MAIRKSQDKKSQETNPRSNTSFDRAVGVRVRAQRILAGMSQEDLGGRLGVSFQQVQKYEKGVNRVSASRLSQIASVFKIPASELYGPDRYADKAPTFPDELQELIHSPRAISLLRKFSKITDAKTQGMLIGLCSKMSRAAAN